jgi:flagellar biosynthesis anti-sigma factor FlgM
MDIRGSLDGLRTLLGVNSPSSPTTQSSGAAATAGNGFLNDRATLSTVASEVSQSASQDGVRSEKVAQIQSALASGAYNVSPSAVAMKLVDAMLGTG